MQKFKVRRQLKSQFKPTRQDDIKWNNIQSKQILHCQNSSKIQ